MAHLPLLVMEHRSLLPTASLQAARQQPNRQACLDRPQPAQVSAVQRM